MFRAGYIRDDEVDNSFAATERVTLALAFSHRDTAARDAVGWLHLLEESLVAGCVSDPARVKDVLCNLQYTVRQQFGLALSWPQLRSAVSKVDSGTADDLTLSRAVKLASGWDTANSENMGVLFKALRHFFSFKWPTTTSVHIRCFILAAVHCELHDTFKGLLEDEGYAWAMAQRLNWSRRDLALKQQWLRACEIMSGTLAQQGTDSECNHAWYLAKWRGKAQLLHLSTRKPPNRLLGVLKTSFVSRKRSVHIKLFSMEQEAAVDEQSLPEALRISQATMTVKAHLKLWKGRLWAEDVQAGGEGGR